MKIKRDLLKVFRDQRDKDGQKLEPEQQVAQHIFQGAAPVSMAGPGAVGEGVKGSIPIEIVANATAAEMARSVSATCGGCRYFNRAKWLKMLNDADNPGSSESERHSVNAIRAEILLRMPDADSHVGGDGEYDIEHALKAMGMCDAMREYYKSKDGVDPGIMGVWPSASCPQEICSTDKPFGLWKPRDGDAERMGVYNYDQVMQTAAGKI